MRQLEKKRQQVGAFLFLLGSFTLLFYKSALADAGVGLFCLGFLLCSFFACIASGGFSQALCDMLRSRLKRDRYLGAKKIRRIAFFIQFILGLLCAVCFGALSAAISETLFGLPYLLYVLLLLAPTIFCNTLSDALCGSLRGEGTYLPDFCLVILRAVLFFGFSGLFVSMLCDYGQKVSALLGKEIYTSMYGALGLSAAYLVACILSLLFLLVVYPALVVKRNLLSGSQGSESTPAIAGQLFQRRFYGMFTGLLSLFVFLFGLRCFVQQAASADAALEQLGIYFGTYLFICLAFLVCICTGLQNGCILAAGCIKRSEVRYAKVQIQSGLHMAFCTGAFGAAFVAIMATPLATLLNTQDTFAVEALQKGSLLILFGAMAFYTLKLLLLIEKRFQSLLLLIAGAVTFFLYVILGMGSGAEAAAEPVLTLVMAGVFATGVMAVLSILVCLLLVRTNFAWVQMLLLPAVGVCGSALLCLLLSGVMTPHLGSAMSVGLLLLMGLMVEWIILLLLRNVKEKECRLLLFGGMVRMLGNIFRVF